MWGQMINGGGYWGGSMLMISHILWWIFILVGALALFRWMRRTDLQDSNFMKKDRAVDILRERYARGEIDKAEFEERKRDLQA